MNRPGPPQPIECSRGGDPHPVPATGGWPCKGHRSRDGKCCANSAMQGQEVCHAHGGRAPQNRRAVERRRGMALVEATVAEERARLEAGVVLPVDPAEAMLAMVGESAMRVRVYQQLVGRLDHEHPNTGVGEYVEDGGERGEGAWSGELAPNLVGLTGNVRAPNEAARHIYVTLYDEERDRLMRYSKMCREAGVDERRVALAEGQVDLMVGVLRGALDGLLALVVGLVGERDAELAGVVEARWHEAEPVIVRGELDRAKGPGGGS